ncbi:hypothetical protein MVEN_01215300 [Mycena venus]|uniref:Pentacotripeptide-repeat region of PRORP domain-containing protein n=1 Tax=Mycena venus TaxID=2733690 RepID=A0A8H6Y600_9AGAR|nr:hypothetical protein MVEN_01215300 [Mycena venus]
MVEPAGSIILNTLLQGRSTFALHSGSIYSASKVMPRPSRIQLTPGFFNPQPRRAKGKERMTDPSRADVLSIYSAQCKEWSCRMRISIYCSGRLENAVVGEEENRRRPRNVRRTRKPATTLPRHAPGAILLQPGQARHASHRSDRPSSDSDPPSSSADSSALDPPTESAAASDNRSLQSIDESIEDLETPDPDPPLLDDISETHSPPALESPPTPVFHPPETTPPPLSEIEKRFKEGDLRYLQLLIAEHKDHVQPEKLWHSYETVQTHGGPSVPTSSELLTLAEKLLNWAESRNQIDELDDLHKWGGRIRRILDSLDPATPPALTLCSLRARALALEGDLQTAVDTIHLERPHYDEFDTYLRVYESILVSTWRHFDRVRAIEFLILEWKTLGSYLLTESSRIHSGSPTIAAAGASLRKTAFAVASGISLPSLVVADKQQDWDDQQRKHLGEFLIEAFLRHQLPMESVDVLREMRRQDVKPTAHIPLSLVRALARDNLYNDAHTLYASVEHDRTYDYLFTGLYLYAHEGQDKWALEYFDRISAAGWRNPKVVLQLMYVYAVQGQTQKTLQVFQEFFPEGENGIPTNSPLVEHFAVGIFAHAQRGDFSGTVWWLEALRKVGLQPDAYVFTTILKSFALRGDLDSIAAVLDQMRAAGQPPNVVTYTTVMTLLAHRKDPASTEAIYTRAIKDGIVPDSMMIATVMNAHIEAGSWKGVIRAFDFVRSSPHMKLTIGIYNLLLKAYLQIGAPFRIVSHIFNQLERLRIRPDAYTFALLIQSACDSRQMNTASDIFTEMERLAEHWGSSRHITTWTMTIIMAGFLRRGDHEQAMAVYEDMVSRGLTPTAVTYGVIISAYGREGTEESLKLAEKFIEDLAEFPQEDRTWETPPPWPSLCTRSLVPPSHAVKMLNDGGEPTLSLLSTLLDAYARVHDIDSVLKLWPQIFQMGVKYSTIPLFENGSDAQRGSKIHTFVLCLPLSRYIDTLSTAGRHDEIANVWKTFQTHGFSFSADNWNQLALALIRAGEVERCFEVLEKVLIPYHRRSNRLRQERDPNPSSPLSLNVPPADRTPLEKPLVGKARSEATKLTRFHRRAGADFANPSHTDDLAYHLHVLHRISPMWNTWQPRHDVLRRLFDTVLRLRAGYPADAVARERDELSLDPDVFREQREVATERLRALYLAYPDAFGLVERFERNERRRLGRWFHKVYSWAATDR